MSCSLFDFNVLKKTNAKPVSITIAMAPPTILPIVPFEKDPDSEDKALTGVYNTVSPTANLEVRCKTVMIESVNFIGIGTLKLRQVSTCSIVRIC